MVSQIKTIHQSPLTDRAIQYTWQQLANRVGIPSQENDKFITGFEPLGISVSYSNIFNESNFSGPAVLVTACENQRWAELLDLAEGGLDWLRISECVPTGTKLPFSNPIPILFWGKGNEHGNNLFAEKVRDGLIIFYADIIASTFFMLSRWEETIIPEIDQHDRFPGYASVAYRQGFLNYPIIDQLAIILQTWIKTLIPGWQPQSRKFSISLSHDIDSIYRFNSHIEAARNLAGDIIKRRNIRSAHQSFSDALFGIIDPNHNSHFQGIRLIANLSKRYNLNSVFNFMSSEPDTINNDYNIASTEVRTCIEDLIRMDFEIGLHSSYKTLNNPELLRIEKEKIERALNINVKGGRQHFLRFHIPDTWSHWEQAGLTYDSTMTYADQEGFRCGTCYPYQPFDLRRDCQFLILELPLIIMDGTLFQYRELTNAQAFETIKFLAQQCKHVGGVFTFLWHNSSFSGSWLHWSEVYPRTLEYLSEM